MALLCRMSLPEPETGTAATAVEPLAYFLPEFDPVIPEPDRALDAQIARLTSSPPTTTPSATEHAPEPEDHEGNYSEVLPPLLVVRKAGIAKPDVVHDPATTEPQLSLMLLRGVWSLAPPLRPLIRSLLAAPRRIRFNLPTRVGQSGPPLRLVGGLACLAVAALITPGFSGPPVQTAQQPDVASTTRPRLAVSELDAYLPPPYERTRPQAARTDASVLARVVLSTAFPRPTPVSLSVVKPAQTPPAQPATPRPKKSTPSPVRLYEGTLVVDSEPAGAAVFIDRRRVGETPLEIPKLRAGSHAVWLEHEGYVRWTAGVLVRADRVTRVERKLEREPDR